MKKIYNCRYPGPLAFALLLGLIQLCPSPAKSHEAWIQPQHYTVGPFDPLHADIRVGEGFLGEQYAYNPQYMKTLTVSAKNVAVDLPAKSGAMPAVVFNPVFSGLHALGYQTTGNIFQHQNWAQFHQYAVSEGLKDSQIVSDLTGWQDNPVNEIYVRHSKTLVNVSDVSAQDSDYRIGHAYEWVAVSNPYQLVPEEAIKLQLWHNQKPLASDHVIVFKRTQKDAGSEVPPKFHKTNANGILTLPAIPGENFLVSTVIFTDKSPSGIDQPRLWQSDWVSISFAVPEIRKNTEKEVLTKLFDK